MPNLLFNYFDIRGRGELTRLIAAAGNIKLEEHLVAFDEWPQIKPTTPLGQLPVLDVDGVPVPQSLAIARYFAGEANVAGRDNVEKLKADAIVLSVYDVHNTLAHLVIEKFAQGKLDEATDGLKCFKENHLDTYFANLEKLIGFYGQNGYSVGNALTWADIYIYDLRSKLVKFYNDNDVLKSFPNVNEVARHVEANPNIAAYLKLRKDSPF